MTRPLNHAAAVANACDEYAEDVRQTYEGATQDRIDRDLLEIEALARTIIGQDINGTTMIGRTEFASVPAPKYSIASLISEVYETHMTPAAHAVLMAMVAKQEAEHANA